MKTILSIYLVFLVFLPLFGQNPIVPPGVYIADPAAHVWNDGKLYIYGSLDESTDYYCSWRHHVMVTENMTDWTIFEDRFASKGENDQVQYNNSLLFAPDCMFKGGFYYLYYCQPDPLNAEGVAISTSPTGLFRDGKALNTFGYNQIDPAVFIDDDGQAFYVWGQFTLKMAQLKSNMTELDEFSIRDSVLTESEHFFHEGAFLSKRNGIYYLVYADLSRAGMPTCLGYATSNFPMGPYKYRGVIVDNDRCDPGNWNNHGSIAEFKGQWYVFYHRSTHNSKMKRKACVEPITFNPDGTIPEVQMTSQGAGSPLSATSKIYAESACSMLGNVRIQLFEPFNEELGQIHHEDRGVFKYIEFDKGVKKVTIRVAPGTSDATIVFKTDMPWGKTLANVEIPKRNGEKIYTTIESNVTNSEISGTHALWLMFYSNNDNRDLDMAVDWFTFK